MARTALSVQNVSVAGLTLAASAANVDGHTVPAGDCDFIIVINGSGGSINVTIPTPGTIDGEPIADRVVAVAAGASKIIGRFRSRVFAQTDGTIHIDFSAVTTVTVAAFKLT